MTAVAKPEQVKIVVAWFMPPTAFYLQHVRRVATTSGAMPFGYCALREVEVHPRVPVTGTLMSDTDNKAEPRGSKIVVRCWCAIF